MEAHRAIFGGWESLMESIPNTNGFSQQWKLVPLTSGASVFPSLHCWCFAQRKELALCETFRGSVNAFLVQFSVLTAVYQDCFLGRYEKPWILQWISLSFPKSSNCLNWWGKNWFWLVEGWVSSRNSYQIGVESGYPCLAEENGPKGVR